MVSDDAGVNIWRLTRFYGNPVTGLWHLSWYLLCCLRDQSSFPWLCIGDFNQLIASSEKSRGARRSEWQMENFWM